jgi:hypothetical protein
VSDRNQDPAERIDAPQTDLSADEVEQSQAPDGAVHDERAPTGIEDWDMDPDRVEQHLDAHGMLEEDDAVPTSPEEALSADEVEQRRRALDDD